MTNTIKCQLISSREGKYTVYVFKLLENEEYILCTRLPNWDIPNINIGESGYLTYEEAIAGNTYFSPKSGKSCTYSYSNIYLKDFIKEKREEELRL